MLACVLALVSTACVAGDADTATEASPSQSSDLASRAEVTFDTGFNVEVDGFGFPNYGNESEVENLSPYSMRMLFGDQVCAQIDGEDCRLTPTALRWMEVQNDGMAGGHCFGMAGLAWALFAGYVDPQAYGSDPPGQMPFDANWGLQADIAAVFVTQETDPTFTERQTVTPNQALEILAQEWAQGQGYVFGIYR
ncbi:MAG: hypothetical protein VW082_07165, partial [Candidatus Nanopelagicales bacterium]